MRYCGHCGAEITLTVAGPCPRCGALLSPSGDLLAPAPSREPWAQGVGNTTIPDGAPARAATPAGWSPATDTREVRRRLGAKRALTVWGVLLLVCAVGLLCVDAMLALAAR